MKQYDNPKKETWTKLTKRPEIDSEELMPLVREVFEQVEKQGDKAIIKYTRLFDHIDLEGVQIDPAIIEEADKNVLKELKEAIDTAIANIKRFHASQLVQKNKVETTKGVECWRVDRGIEKVGLYIPGGGAPLFSTVLMLAIPAKLAGCKEVVLCTPPNKAGKIDDTILYAAKKTGVDKVIMAGGIQAIAGLTFGTESIPKVYKIVGPGNQYVTAAKQFSQFKGMQIDMPAGPSEVLVTADETANPEFIAADLISQAEHGLDSQSIGLFNSIDLLKATAKAVDDQVRTLPRAEIIKKALTNSALIFLESQKDRIDFINEYAPEHLIIAENNSEMILNKVQNAGSVFLGNYTPESAGDYASGTNHTLPTNGFAKSYSGVNMTTFLKSITVQRISPAGLKALGKTIETMAAAEQLEGHKAAVSIRLKTLENEY